jgi:hypothetical protein
MNGKGEVWSAYYPPMRQDMNIQSSFCQVGAQVKRMIGLASSQRGKSRRDH